MEAPPIPQLTPEQLQKAAKYLPIEQIYTAAAYTTPQNLKYQIDHIEDDRGPEIIATTIIIAILATLAVLLRLLCRRRMKVAISYDDYLMMAGFVFALAQCFLQGYSVDVGLGKHLIAVGMPATQKYIRIQYAYEFFWSAAMACIKLSILLFYRRLFPRENTSARWRICHLALCIASMALGVVSLFGVAFQCTPVAYLWDRTIPGGHCINFTALARFTNIANMVTDILILIMPIPIVWNLHLDRSKKIGVCGLFLLGGFVCIASIVRFYYLEGIINSPDPTWDIVDPSIWTTVEPCIGVVSACLPIMAPFLRTHIMAFSTSVFRSRKPWRGADSGYTGQSGPAGANNSGSRDRKSFGRIRIDGKGSNLKGTQDEEMGIPLKEPTAVQVREDKDRSSRFIAIYSPSLSAKELQARPEFNDAMHRIAAWRLPSMQRSLTESLRLYDTGYDEDGEKYAGKALTSVLSDFKAEGAIVVARWYGGILLGPVRFHHIKNCAREAISKYLNSNERQAKKLRASAEEIKRKDDLIRILLARDQSISVLRGLLAEKQSVPSPSPKEETPKPSPTKVPEYAQLPLRMLENLERARDATIGWILAQIETIEAVQQASNGSSKSAAQVSNNSAIGEGTDADAIPKPQHGERKSRLCPHT
ncbi:MAG: hypothetical protein Q9209_004008 [Squamulea sp. 1 TL-2023]